MTEENFTIKFINHEFEDDDEMIRFLDENNLLKGVSLKRICTNLKKNNNNILKMPGCQTKKKDDIIKILIEKYTSPIEETHEIERNYIKMKGQEFIILTTKEHADEIQNIIDKEDSLHSRLESLELQILEQQTQIKNLMSTIDNVIAENTQLKQNTDCTSVYNCSDKEICNANTGECDSENDLESDDDLDHFISIEGQKYIGNKIQIKKIKEKIEKKQQLINTAQQNISDPNELPETYYEDDNIDSLVQTLSDIQKSEENRLQDKIQIILNN